MAEAENNGGGQQQIRATPYASPMHNFGSSIVLLTNPEDKVFKLEIFLRGMVVDAKGVAEPSGEALLNDKGVCSVLGNVQSLVNQDTVMSNLNEQEIPILMDFFGDTLAKDLMVNRVLYGINNPAARDKIYMASFNCVYICLKRAFEEGDKRFWKGSVQEFRTTTEPSKPSGIGSVFSWGKK